MLRDALCVFFASVLVLCGITATAQQDAHFTQYMFNSVYLTPSAAGASGVTEATAIHRSQWLGYESSFNDGTAPSSQLVSFSAPIHRLKSGFATYILNDKLGPQNNLEVQAMYAYHLGIRENKLSFGIKLGIYSQTLDFNKYRLIQPNDPLLIDPGTGQLRTGKESQIRPDLGLGLMYRTEKYYAAIGFNHLIKSEFDFGVSQRNALVNHMNFTAGYFYDVNFDLQLNPTVLLKTDFNEFSVDVGVLATLRNTMWGGLSFRSGEAANLLLGYSFLKDKALRLGYAIDVVVKDRAAKENFSHEILLTYQLPVSVGVGKKIVRTPRYRH
ncbi:MAG: membrane protein [Cyclobacteriaceae bacterium]|nr:MAG: membrane protein [Cyclobacteriaceae bacterium]